MSSERIVSQKSAKELKEEAIRKALSDAAKSASLSIETNETGKKSKKVRKTTLKFSFGRFAFAFVCAAASVFSLIYLININTPDVSMKVAAIQTGIDASYPSYIPRNFSLSSVVSEEGKITMTFANSETQTTFTLTEENSSWDSTALLNNYVKEEFSKDYVTVREQGLTIYIDNGNAAWVNGGLVFKLNTVSGSLTKKQITSIAVSL